MRELEKVRHSELRLGDVVKCYDGEWSTAIVQQVDETSVHLFRPYARAEGFSYSGGVTCLTGVEHFSIWRDSERMIELYRRGGELK